MDSSSRTSSSPRTSNAPAVSTATSSAARSFSPASRRSSRPRTAGSSSTPDFQNAFQTRPWRGERRTRKKRRCAALVQSLFRTRTVDPLLILRQLVAKRRQRSSLVLADSAPIRFATDCHGLQVELLSCLATKGRSAERFRPGASKNPDPRVVRPGVAAEPPSPDPSWSSEAVH